jgi:heat shock protein HtpX
MRGLTARKAWNITKTVIFIILIGALVYILVDFLSFLLNPNYARLSLSYGLIASVLYVLIGVIGGPKLVLASVGARPLEEHARYEEVLEITKELCEKSNLPIPKLYYFNAHDINAFATGYTPGNACIAISSGALRYLSREELAGVIGHELGHIKHFDTLQMTVVAVLVGLISFITNWIMFSLFWGSDERPAWVEILALIVAIITPLIATIIQMAISREREYHADLFSAEINGSPDGLVSAFRKIEMINRGNIPKTEALEPLYFVSFEELFSTHPPIEKRIENLLKAFER